LRVVAAATSPEGSEGTIDSADAELAVVIGGDGAILRACRGFGLRQLPILGVNAGRLGFLAELSPQEFCDNVEWIERREYEVAEHLMFECEHRRGDGSVRTYLGLNEAAFLAGGALRMIETRLSIDDAPVTTYSGDGLIISTPVGSTAHSLSAGGPILRQDLNAFVVTPICPHTLTVRPLVDSADCAYRVTIPDAPEGVMLVIDGQIKEPFGPGDAAVIRRAGVTFQLARIPGHSFYGTLHRKLGWAGQPRYEGGS
jgi:NAD+ kinase